MSSFRDRWALDAYSDHPGWRQALDRRQERRVIEGAAGVVTVSPLWAESYAERYGADRVAVSMNGFDPEDYPAGRTAPPRFGPDTLELLYAGGLYPGRREPEPVFAALARMGAAAEGVRITMLGKDLALARAQAVAHGVSGSLDILPSEPHGRIIDRQYAADALLMLQWNDPADAGTVPGKLFECMAARRPVIATGYEDGVAGRIIREAGLGVIANAPADLAAAIGALVAEKRAQGRIAPLPASVRDGYSRAEQFSRLDDLLDRAAHRR